MNAKISKRLDTSPFSLMFARKWNDFKDYREEPVAPPMSNKEFKERIELMSEFVFPAISERTKAVVEKQKGNFDTKHKIVQFPPKSHVMVKSQAKRLLDPRYEGPYTVARETKGGSYVLQDAQGELLPRNLSTFTLKTYISRRDGAS